MNDDDGPEPGVGLCDVVCAWLLPAALLFGLFVFSVVQLEISGSTETARSDYAETAEMESGRIRQDVLPSYANRDGH
ncbi:MAG: hypothetical protein OEM93_07910 [Rhodospirillales bacterium]|nr:hypothetical protein [Rhodospirillales bacterium]MDH3919244.1 hypothetical protein [Rhodospirillales bacterium]MDH3969770.1 hypothetical protein [Rhodospirillales bacterium]